MSTAQPRTGTRKQTTNPIQKSLGLAPRRVGPRDQSLRHSLLVTCYLLLVTSLHTSSAYPKMRLLSSNCCDGGSQLQMSTTRQSWPNGRAHYGTTTEEAGARKKKRTEKHKAKREEGKKEQVNQETVEDEGGWLARHSTIEEMDRPHRLDMCAWAYEQRAVCSGGLVVVVEAVVL